MAAKRLRTKSMNIRMSEPEKDRLHAVASALNLTIASAVRFLVKREFDKIQKDK